LGTPAVTVVLPNVLWHWIANPHTDHVYADAFERKTAHQKLDCQRTANAGFKSFLLPLTLPEGTGLLYWEPNGTRCEVLYEMGKVYTFDVSCVHAIRPLSYHDCNRKNIRITVQAFGVWNVKAMHRTSIKASGLFFTKIIYTSNIKNYCRWKINNNNA